MRPTFTKLYDEWKFFFPEEMEDVNDEYYTAIEFLGYDEKECQKRLKKIITKFPECHIDAYNHISISFRNQNKTHESFHYALTSYLLGKNCFPTDFKEESDKIIWLDIDNRPFLRACQVLGLEFQYKKNYERAIQIYKENLSYNEMDNQGIRYLLLECYFENKNFEEIRKLLEKYPDDFSVEFLYGTILLNILTDRTQDLGAYITDAIKCNRYVIDEIIKDNHSNSSQLEDENSDMGIVAGSIQEAQEYCLRNKRILTQKKVKNEFKKIKETLSN